MAVVVCAPCFRFIGTDRVKRRTSRLPRNRKPGSRGAVICGGIDEGRVCFYIGGDLRVGTHASPAAVRKQEVGNFTEKSAECHGREPGVHNERRHVIGSGRHHQIAADLVMRHQIGFQCFGAAVGGGEVFLVGGHAEAGGAGTKTGPRTAWSPCGALRAGISHMNMDAVTAPMRCRNSRNNCEEKALTYNGSP